MIVFWIAILLILYIDYKIQESRADKKFIESWNNRRR